MRFCVLLTLVILALSGTGFAHPADVSYLRVAIGEQHIQTRLTLNLLTLTRITVIDADHNQRITPAELNKAAPLIAAFLRDKVLVTLNDQTVDLGDFTGHESVWPNADTAEVTDQEASERYVDFNFTHRWPTGVKELWLGLDCFAQLGSLHTFQAVYEQNGHPPFQIEFSERAPEFLYDTGWTEADFIKANAASRDFHPWALAFGVAAVLTVVLVWLRNARRK